MRRISYSSSETVRFCRSTSTAGSVLALVAVDGAVVVGEIRRELVGAVVARDEVEVVLVGRMQRRHQRGAAGARDRSGRKPDGRVGVVGSRRLEVLSGQVAVEVLDSV